MKRILMLGGSVFQVPAIKYAKEAGYYVITADYLPNNPGHEFSDEYHNVSTTDKDKILNLATKLNIDGIISYASDPGAPTAAYVAETLSLPGNPYESVRVLQRKDLFKEFLKSNRFMVPASASFTNYDAALEFASERLKLRSVVIKPADSCGSKGVTKLNETANFDKSFKLAMNYSISKIVVVEDFIEKAIYEMDGDGFVWNGKLVFRCFGNQHNDIECNPFVPVGISFPYIQDMEIQQKAHDEVERVLSLLNMKVGGLNIEYLTEENGDIYILEIGPRSGGNLIPEVIKYATGVDLIEYSVEGALGRDCSGLKMSETRGYYSSYILHAQKDGIVKDIWISPEIENHIIEKNIIVRTGERIQKFDNSRNTLGTFILGFQNQSQMINYLDNMNMFIKVIVN